MARYTRFIIYVRIVTRVTFDSDPILISMTFDCILTVLLCTVDTFTLVFMHGIQRALMLLCQIKVFNTKYINYELSSKYLYANLCHTIG